MLSISSIKFSTVAWIRHGWPNYSGWRFWTKPFARYERQKWEIIFPPKKIGVKIPKRIFEKTLPPPNCTGSLQALPIKKLESLRHMQHPPSSSASADRDEVKLMFFPPFFESAARRKFAANPRRCPPCSWNVGKPRECSRGEWGFAQWELSLPPESSKLLLDLMVTVTG